MVDLWHAKCGGCIPHLKATQKIQEHFSSNPEIKIFAVNSGYNSLTAIKEFKRRFDFKTTFYIDQDTSISKFLQINTYPRTLIIDKKGKLRFQIDGFSKEWESEYQEKVIATIKTLNKE